MEQIGIQVGGNILRFGREKVVNMENIYIIPNQHKPVKIKFEDTYNNVLCKNIKPSIQEVLISILRELWANNKITGQQYKVERGKIRRNYCDQVTNFLTKRGISQTDIIEKLNEESQVLTFTKRIPVHCVNGQFGVYRL